MSRRPGGAFWTMETSSRYFRSPELMQPADTVLVVVDVQERLLPAIDRQALIQWNIRRLLDAARVLEVPALATEQYPRGLGATVQSLAAYFDDPPAKLCFSCAGSEEFRRQLHGMKRAKVLLVGIETHVCIQQTALDLMSAGYHVYLAVDAIGARAALDHDVAIRRLETLGATVTTTEAVVFEWCEVAGTEQFKAIRELVMETPPALPSGG